MQNIKRQLRACLKIAWGPAARDFGGGQGGEAGASPQRAVTAEPTPANAKRSAARRVFAEKARWLRCCAITGPAWPCSLDTPRQRAFSATTGPHGIFRQALTQIPLQNPLTHAPRLAPHASRSRITVLRLPGLLLNLCRA